ncbi:hypothetical protein [Flavobacterium hungaricum]|uniref:Lipocalin-like domain-containing protein n=1 Tax=Flavobacterium hungaricum TaxID=2082725 RepID=A0ABR9TTB5_9FLAO|nr:hypothetical protein [Flavobacterium hungaricum]MBE8727882.1 hypothetical protein [Flavobacterium hungaricum]
MSRSIRKIQIVFCLILNLFFAVSAFAQIDIAGKWETKDVLGYSDVKEYSLTKAKESSYGRFLTFKLDGTFLSDESIKCLNGCNVFTSGTYVLVDNEHVRIIVEDVRFVGFYCGMQRSDEEEYIKDLGVFYIYREGDSIRLIPSNGILQDDKDKMLYHQLAASFDKEWRSYNYVWKNTEKTEPEEIIKECIEDEKWIEWSNCKILIPSLQGNLFIVKENQKLHYVLYNEYKKKVSLAYPKNKS